MELLNACRSSQAFLQNLMACFQEAILVADSDGKILMANDAVKSLFGYSPEELHNKSLSIIFTSEDLTYFYPNLIRMGRKGMSFQGEALLLTKNNARFFAFINLRSFHDSTLNRSFVFISVADINERKHYERTPSGSNYEDLVKVANGVAHELRNPLVGIGGFINRLYDKCNALPEHARYYDHIIRNLKKIEVVIRKVEYLARLPKPSLSMEKIRNIARKGIEPYISTLKERGIASKVLLDGVVLKCDPKLIIRVFSILMENALDAMDDGCSITVRSAASDNLCEIEFSDTGPGISEEDLPFIFNPFFSTKADGAGIDLAIVKRIVESHGGSVHVRSQEGHGATFLLKFPLERRRAIRISKI